MYKYFSSAVVNIDNYTHIVSVFAKMYVYDFGEFSNCCSKYSTGGNTLPCGTPDIDGSI